jgi:hypothetical protein
MVDLRAFPLLFYAAMTVCIKSNDWLGYNLYSDYATLGLQVTAMIHASECVTKLSVLRRDAAEGGPPLPMQLIFTLIFGFFHWYKIEAHQQHADREAKKE